MNNQIQQNLESLGLSEEEITIYTFLLQNGDKTVLELARGTNMNRSKIYRILDILKSKHLVESNNDNWGEIYAASDIENLKILLHKEEEVLQNKKNLLNDTIEELSNMQSGHSNHFKIKHYIGEDGLKQMLWNELKSKELLAFGSGTLNDFVGIKFAEKLRKENILRKMKIYEIGNDISDSSYTEEKLFIEKVLSYKHIDPKILTIENHIEVYNNTIAIFNWNDKDLKGVEIYSQSFATLFKQIFWHYWEIAQ